MARTVVAPILVVLLIGLASPGAAAAATREELVSLVVPNGTVTLAETVAAGSFTPPSGRQGGPPGAASPYARLGAFCRVAVTLKPASRSEITAEVWLPSSGWNGKLQVVGNGGFAGTISYGAMANALASGYASASTDTGHTGPAANTFANEDVLTDFAHRAIHETAVSAKAAVFPAAAPAAGDRCTTTGLCSGLLRVARCATRGATHDTTEC